MLLLIPPKKMGLRVYTTTSSQKIALLYYANTLLNLKQNIKCVIWVEERLWAGITVISYTLFSKARVHKL
jgi:hypothetical protein